MQQDSPQHSHRSGHALRAVLFDLDGTLLDTAADFIAVLQRLCTAEGVSAPSEAAIRHTVSDGARALIQLAFGGSEGEAEFERLRQALLDDYRQNLAVHSCFFPGLDQALQQLEQAGIAWGIVTNKPSEYAEPLIEQLGLKERCAVLLCPDHVGERKPHPESLFLACERIGCEAKEAIYIGDHPRDIEAGRRAGMDTIACAYGYVPIDSDIRDWGADHIMERSEDLLAAIDALPNVQRNAPALQR